MVGFLALHVVDVVCRALNCCNRKCAPPCAQAPHPHGVMLGRVYCIACPILFTCYTDNPWVLHPFPCPHAQHIDRLVDLYSILYENGDVAAATESLSQNLRQHIKVTRSACAGLCEAILTRGAMPGSLK